MKVTLNRRMRIGGRQYMTGDAASVSRANARVLVAVGHAKHFVDKPAAKTVVPPAPAAHRTVEFSGTHAGAGSIHDHHEAHQETRHAAAARTAPKATAAPKKAPGQKIEK